MPSPSRDGLSVAEAAVLGLIHGPAELLPVSSSGHVSAIPWLLCWDYVELDPELRKAFEVALHAGTAVALLIASRAEVDAAACGLDVRALTLTALALAPAVLAGFTLERPIEEHLGTPATLAAGMLAGSAALAWGDRSPQERDHQQLGLADALWIGTAQAMALFPGVSRNGATLAAARRRRFTRPEANVLSRHLALPVITGASVLKGWRLVRRGVPPEFRAAFAVGAGVSLASTLLSARLLGRVERDRPLARFAVYRVGLAAVILVRTRRRCGGSGPSRI
jgi:undecaprenyl-diphosphatase